MKKHNFNSSAKWFDKNVSTRDEADLKVLSKSNIPIGKSKKKKKLKGKCS